MNDDLKGARLPRKLLEGFTSWLQHGKPKILRWVVAAALLLIVAYLVEGIVLAALGLIAAAALTMGQFMLLWFLEDSRIVVFFNSTEAVYEFLLPKEKRGELTGWSFALGWLGDCCACGAVLSNRHAD